MIDYRWAEGRNDRLPPLAAELEQIQVDFTRSLVPEIVQCLGSAEASSE
jgi:hypothetical protein